MAYVSGSSHRLKLNPSDHTMESPNFKSSVVTLLRESAITDVLGGVTRFQSEKKPSGLCLPVPTGRSREQLNRLADLVTVN
jgi:hypothetical protein